MHRERRHRFGAVAATFATAWYTAWLAWGVGGERSVLYVADLGTVLAALVATALCLRAGFRHAGTLRRFWLLLAAACGAWTVAEAIWAVYQLVLGTEVPVPSLADVGYLGAIPLAVAALLSHPAMRGGGGRRTPALIDGLAIATALLFLSWTFVLGPLWESTDLTTAGGLVALAYPFGDVVIVFFILLVIRRMTRDGRLSLWWLLAGLLALALADSAYAYLVEVNAYQAGTPLDSGWVAGYLAIAVGALCTDSRGGVARRAKPAPALAPVLAAFLPMLAALTVVGIQIELGQRPDRAALVMAFALVVISLVRQALLVLELIAPTTSGRAGSSCGCTRPCAAERSRSESTPLRRCRRTDRRCDHHRFPPPSGLGAPAGRFGGRRRPCSRAPRGDTASLAGRTRPGLDRGLTPVRDHDDLPVRHVPPRVVRGELTEPS